MRWHVTLLQQCLANGNCTILVISFFSLQQVDLAHWLLMSVIRLIIKLHWGICIIFFWNIVGNLFTQFSFQVHLQFPFFPQTCTFFSLTELFRIPRLSGISLAFLTLNLASMPFPHSAFFVFGGEPGDLLRELAHIPPPPGSLSWPLLHPNAELNPLWFCVCVCVCVCVCLHAQMMSFVDICHSACTMVVSFLSMSLSKCNSLRTGAILYLFFFNPQDPVQFWGT
jgi:hypothetical protein